jgi:hypothetical protein
MSWLNMYEMKFVVLKSFTWFFSVVTFPCHPHVRCSSKQGQNGHFACRVSLVKSQTEAF